MLSGVVVEVVLEFGWWFRWEAQFNAKKAETMTRALSGSEDVSELARSWAVGCIRNLAVIEPRLFKLLGEKPLISRAEKENVEWEAFVEHAHHTLFGKAAMIAEAKGVDIMQVIEAMEPQRAIPTIRKGHHGGVISSCPVGRKWYH